MTAEDLLATKACLQLCGTSAVPPCSLLPDWWAADSPWLVSPAALQPSLDPDVQVDLSTENWCGVLQEVALPGTGADPAAFMDQAVAFANDRIWGTLSCCIFVPDEVSWPGGSQRNICGPILTRAPCGLCLHPLRCISPDMLLYCAVGPSWCAFEPI